MLVSVITICFNSEAVIRKTIESVLNQTWDKLEYLIVDGASKDRTVAIAEEYSERFAAKGVDYRIYSEPDRGIYDAMNKGIRLSSGDLVGLINSGDWYEPDAVETAVKAYEKEPYDLFYADINLIKENGSVMVKHSKKDRFPTSRHWNHPTMFVARKTYQELGLYRNEGIHDDFELYLRAGILAIEHCIALFEHHLFVFRTVTGCDNSSLKWFFLCGVGDNDSTDFFLCRGWQYEHPVG